MKIIPMPLQWPNVWWLCTLELDPDEGVRRFGPFHREETDSAVVAGPEEAWAFGFPCGLEVLLIRHRGVQKGRLWELQGNLPEPQHAIEHLGVTSAPVTWRADRVRAHETKIQTEPGRFEVWRLDDNGNEALVDVLGSEATANCVVHSYEARPHKQTYFVRHA
jgi:hypothetical protein